MFFTILLNLIIFFLPTQLGLHFWPDFSRAAGIKVDYLSPTIYFIDILLLLYICLVYRKIVDWLKHHFFETIVFLSFAFLNIFLGVSPQNSLFWWLRIILYSLFFLSLRLQKVGWSQIRRPLFVSICFIVFLQIIQTINQHSVGGIFYWLGEREFSSSTQGLAKLNLLGWDFIRVPSTFSHPNSLSGFLLIAYLIFDHYKSPLWHRLVIFLGLLITLSKAALLAFFLVISLQINSIILIYIFLFFSLLQPFLSTIPNTFQFIADRLFLLQPTKSMILHSSLDGVGLGNFIPSLVDYLPGSSLVNSKLQPVHNLPLLVLSEVGVLGISFFVIFVKKYMKLLSNPHLLRLIALLLITGAFDHYGWTLPQNRLIFLLAAAIML